MFTSYDIKFIFLGKRKKKIINRYTSLARTKGIEKNIIAKKCIEKIEYAPDQISLSFYLKQKSIDAPDCNAPVRIRADRKNAPAQKNENPTPVKESEVRLVSSWYLPDALPNPKITIPNLIHGSK
ncbi:MAG: hypothetical protein Q7K28_00360, partial [Candidatus Wildermuthbacteria bacterium]|nr:hypothetical protein [Candidatus Wildermuthbacteria bacterium]